MSEPWIRVHSQDAFDVIIPKQNGSYSQALQRMVAFVKAGAVLPFPRAQEEELESEHETRREECGLGAFAVVAVGGCSEGRAMPEVSCWNPALGAARSLAPLKRSRRGHASVVHNGVLIVAGGCGDFKIPMRSVEAYDVFANEWTAMPSLRIPRSSPALVSLNDALYIIGGKSFVRHLCSVERLDSGALAWTAVAPLPAALEGHSALVANNCIFVFGQDIGTNTCVWCYDPAVNTWTARPHPRSYRLDFALAVHSENAYIVAHQPCAQTVLLEYHLLTGTYGALEHLPQPDCNAPGCGRESRDKMVVCCAPVAGNIDLFMLKNRKWTHVRRGPSTMQGMTATTLFLPIAR